MGHRRNASKRSRAKTILRLPDLEQSKNAVLNSLADGQFAGIVWICHRGIHGLVLFRAALGLQP